MSHDKIQPESGQLIQVTGQLTPAEAMIIKGRLESNEIPTFVKQEAMGSLLGLTTGPMGWAIIFVPEAYVEQAHAILSETYEANELN